MRLHHRLGAVTAGAAIAATVATLFVGTGAAFADDGPVNAGITINKIAGLPADFINGVDVSSILAEEDSGVVFRDFNGDVADPFDVLAEAGINYVRVRVWNDPYNSVTHLGYGAGNTDAAAALEIGERATAAGLKVLVDFHYSDFWADPGKQKAPKAWASMSLAQKGVATHDYTAATLQAMKNAGVNVGMVQIGNETNGAVAGVTGIPNMATIFSAGSAAVREVYPSALVALHFTNPETSGRYAGYASQLQTAGVDYDVFASSYYPYWHGTLANLTSVLSSIATTYGKKVMVAETSYMNTLADGDGTANSVSAVSGTEVYPVSVQGQGTEIRDVMNAVNNVSNSAGLGVFYWEPAWIPVPGATLAERQAKWAQFGSGWATTAAAEYDSGAPTVNAEGSGWDNQALFDYNGNPLESLRAFAYARTGAVAPRTMTSVSTPTVTAAVGATITLPSTVTVTYNDSTTESQAVTWDNVLPWITSAGTYTVNGVTSAGYATKATVTVSLTNYVVNPGFENSAATPWTITNGSQGCSIAATTDAVSGAKAFKFYRASALTCSVQQTITGLAAGTYTLTGWAHGGAFSSGTMQLRGVTSGDTYNTALNVTAFGERNKASEIVTVGANGQIVVSGQITNASAGVWGTFDDFSLTKYTANTIDTSGLAALVSQAAGLTRSVYSADSLATLDHSVVIAKLVIAASLPTQQQVTDATALVTNALAGLVIVGDVPDPIVTNPTVTVVDGNPITLPATAKVTFFDGRFEQQSVTWEDVLGLVSGPGTYSIHGVTEDGLAVTATLVVKVHSYLVNGDFEQGNLTGWTTSATTWPSQFWYDTTAGSVHGTTALNIYGSAAYDFTLSQAVSGLEPGTYRLAVQAHGIDSGTLLSTLQATTSEGTVSTPVTLTGWANWGTFGVNVTVPADGAVTVGVSGTGAAADWGYFDDFTLTALPHDADTTALDAAVAAANGLDRDLYEPQTLPAIDDALAAYAVFAGADDPSQAAVDSMTTRFQDALDQLDLIDVAFETAAKPTIEGTVAVGETLTANAGTWVPTPSGITYQWLRDGDPIADATHATYVVTEDDVLADLSVTVTGTKADVITESKTSGTITVPLQEFTDAPAPVVTGDVTVGSTLTAAAGTWAPAPAAVTYQWLRDGDEIDGATASTYVLTADDRGTVVTVKVTAARGLFATTSKVSTGTDIPSVFTDTPAPTITGDVTAGSTLTAHAGTWAPEPGSVTYQWLRDGDEIDGATASTYVLTVDDRGADITVEVTGNLAGYFSVTKASVATHVPSVFTTTPVPTISGGTTSGSTLTATPGTWVPAAAAFQYQWLRNGAAISGANASTYVLTVADRGTSITVAVTALKSGFTPATKTSAAKAIPSVFTTQVTPQVTGTPLVGKTLTAIRGTWNPAPSAYAYQWYRDGKVIAGATAKTYKVKSADLAHKITVKVTATRSGFTAASKTSSSVTIVKPFAHKGEASITGTWKVGKSLTAHRGIWSPTPSSYSFQWYRNGVAITGATGVNYTLKSADKGKKVTVKVTAKKSGYLPTSSTAFARTVS